MKFTVQEPKRLFLCEEGEFCDLSILPNDFWDVGFQSIELYEQLNRDWESI